MANSKLDINNLSTSQQVALLAILRLKRKSFFSSEVAASKLFNDEGKKAIGGILGALYRNGFIEKVSGGRDKLWKLNKDVESRRNFYKNEITKVKTYWR